MMCLSVRTLLRYLHILSRKVRPNSGIAQSRKQLVSYESASQLTMRFPPYFTVPMGGLTETSHRIISIRPPMAGVSQLFYLLKLMRLYELTPIPYQEGAIIFSPSSDLISMALPPPPQCKCSNCKK